MIVYRLKN